MGNGLISDRSSSDQCAVWKHNWTSVGDRREIGGSMQNFVQCFNYCPTMKFFLHLPDYFFHQLLPKNDFNVHITSFYVEASPTDLIRIGYESEWRRALGVQEHSGDGNRSI